MIPVQRDTPAKDQLWEPAFLGSACAILASDQQGVMVRLTLCGACPVESGGALRVLYLAQELARTHHLLVWGSIQGGLLSITFDKCMSVTRER